MWRVYLPSERTRQWIVFRYHDNTFPSLHRTIYGVRNTDKKLETKKVRTRSFVHVRVRTKLVHERVRKSDFGVTLGCLEKVLHAVRKPLKGPAFWLDGMTKDIARMIRACEICQVNKDLDIMNQAPLGFRRWQKRFTRIQLDLAGHFSLSSQIDVIPWETEYLCLMICEVRIRICTHVCLAVPAKSTSARDVIGSLLNEQCSYSLGHMVSPRASQLMHAQLMIMRHFVSSPRHGGRR